MKLEMIVTLASAEVRLRFLAMERSLRATGCGLPLRVIPYNNNLFTLPSGANWWLDRSISDWLECWKAHPMMRKYQCLTISNYQFVDADVCFLRNPADVLAPLSGFVTSCGHWREPGHTVTNQSRQILVRNSTNWQKDVFNAGQWASDRVLFTFDELKNRCELPEFRDTCLTFPFNDQPGVNMLVNSTGVPIHNLTLPPWNMQSTWAGDYPNEYQQYWKTPEVTPYLIHWAGVRMEDSRPIDELIEKQLSSAELTEWREQISYMARQRKRQAARFRVRLGRLKRAVLAFRTALIRG